MFKAIASNNLRLKEVARLTKEITELLLNVQDQFPNNFTNEGNELARLAAELTDLLMDIEGQMSDGVNDIDQRKLALVSKNADAFGTASASNGRSPPSIAQPDRPDNGAALGMLRRARNEELESPRLGLASVNSQFPTGLARADRFFPGSPTPMPFSDKAPVRTPFGEYPIQRRSVFRRR